jgi:hypothetical protein
MSLLISMSGPARADCGCNVKPYLSSGPVASAGVPGPMIVANSMAVLATVPPPPGTIGQTYTRVSHPIPEDEHPRTAMLAVRDNRQVEHLSVQRMGGFRMDNGVWLFETERPTIPGVENIVRVEARREANDIQPYKVMFVRLIPGRIVYLDWGPPQPEAQIQVN